MTSVPLASSFYVDSARQFSSQRLVNCFLEPGPATGETRSKFIIKHTPGSIQLAGIDSGPIRAMKTIGERLFVVSNNSLYTIATTGAVTNHGVIMLSQNYVDLIAGPSQVLLCCGLFGYVYDLTADTLTAISDPDFPGASSGLFMDGSAIVLKPSSAQSNISDIVDFTSWDPLAFTNETTVPGNILAIRDDRKEFWMFGEKIIVPYTRTGQGNYPYQRVTESVMDMGVVAQWAVVVTDNSYFWLGQRSNEGGYAVWRAAGYTPQRISTYPIEHQIEKLPKAIVANAIAFSYMMAGHLFYVLNFPGYASFVYDVATGLWHEWNRFREAWSTYTHHAVFNGQHVVGGADGKIYVLDPETYMDGALPIQRRIVTPVYEVNGEPFSLDQVELGLQTGIGLTSGQGDDPQIMMRVSKDGGMTYGREYWRAAGKKGNYNCRALWRNMGRAYEMTLEFTMSDPVPLAVFEASAEISA